LSILLNKNSESFSEYNAKNSAWRFITVTEKSSKNRNDFTQLWRQWSCTVYSKSRFIQLCTDLANIEVRRILTLSYTDIGLDVWLTTKLNTFWFLE